MDCIELVIIEMVIIVITYVVLVSDLEFWYNCDILDLHLGLIQSTISKYIMSRQTKDENHLKSFKIISNKK